MKTCVISGGGSWGAFTIGKLKTLKPDYDLVLGSSTGALMAPFVALGEWDRLIEVYSSVNNKSIFNVNPFNAKGNIKILNAAWRIISGKKTLGESLNLYNLIQEIFTQEDYFRIRHLNKNVVVTVCNLETEESEYHSINDHTYEDFCKYMWASSAFPFVSSIVEINGVDYVDGGTTENVPLREAVLLGGTDIDVFIHDVISKPKGGEIKNLFHLVLRILGIMRSTIVNNDVTDGQSLIDLFNERFKEDVQVRYHYLKEEPTTSYLVFNEKIIRGWISEGRNGIDDYNG